MWHCRCLYCYIACSAVHIYSHTSVAILARTFCFDQAAQRACVVLSWRASRTLAWAGQLLMQCWRGMKIQSSCSTTKKVLVRIYGESSLNPATLLSENNFRRNPNVIRFNKLYVRIWKKVPCFAQIKFEMKSMCVRTLRWQSGCQRKFFCLWI